MNDRDPIILDNTLPGTTPLVPEIALRLLCDHSPLWGSFREATAYDGPRPYWAFAWSGGQALARYVLDHPNEVKGKRVFDFGAGCGLAGIAAAKAGAAQVTAADIDPISIRAIAHNAEANNVTIEALCRDFIYEENQGWEVVLAGDVWYDSRVFRHGLAWLRGLADQGVRILTGDPGRAYSPSQGLERLADYACRSVPDLEHPLMKRVSVYSLRR